MFWTTEPFRFTKPHNVQVILGLDAEERERIHEEALYVPGVKVGKNHAEMSNEERRQESQMSDDELNEADQAYELEIDQAYKAWAGEDTSEEWGDPLSNAMWREYVEAIRWLRDQGMLDRVKMTPQESDQSHHSGLVINFSSAEDAAAFLKSHQQVAA